MIHVIQHTAAIMAPESEDEEHTPATKLLEERERETVCVCGNHLCAHIKY